MEFKFGIGMRTLNHARGARCCNDAGPTCLMRQRRYGGDYYELAKAICPASDGGYVIAGYTKSFKRGDIDDFWVLKLTHIVICDGSP